MMYAIQVCRQLSSRIKMELQFHPDSAAARELSTNLHDIYHRCGHGEKLLMMEKGIVRNM
jgi:hypothetical protein